VSVTQRYLGEELGDKIERLHADLARVTAERDAALAALEDVRRVVAPAEGATVAEGARYRIEMYASTCADAIAERNAARRDRDESLGTIARTLALQLPPNDQVQAITLDIGRLLDKERRWSDACALAHQHCPVDAGQSYIRDGIPRLAATVVRLTAERDEALAALEDIKGECHRLRVDLKTAARVAFGDAPAAAPVLTEEAAIAEAVAAERERCALLAISWCDARNLASEIRKGGGT
jgi:hypothetical protein